MTGCVICCVMFVACNVMLYVMLCTMLCYVVCRGRVGGGGAAAVGSVMSPVPAQPRCQPELCSHSIDC